MARKRCCENCVFSGKVRDGEKILYVCSNVPDCPGQTVLRPPDGLCPHFRLNRKRTAWSPPKPSDDPWVRHIPLTQGLYAKVDASDYGWLNLHRWWAARAGNTYYAERRRDGKLVTMHQEIMVPAEGYVVDHIDGEGWNNCRDNLRNCTRTQNSRNRRKQSKPATSPYKGVRRDRKYGKCRVYIGHEGKKIYLDTFWDEIEAARAYDRAAVKYHGRFARLNFPEEWVTGEWKPVDHEPEDEGPQGGLCPPIPSPQRHRGHREDCLSADTLAPAKAGVCADCRRFSFVIPAKLRPERSRTGRESRFFNRERRERRERTQGRRQ